MDGSCVTLDSYRGYIDAAASAYYILSLASDTGKYIYLFVGYIHGMGRTVHGTVMSVQGQGSPEDTIY